MTQVQHPPTAYDWTFPQVVSSYPTVTHTWETASNLYAATKGYNQLTGYAASLLERTAGTAYWLSTPMLRRVEPQLVRVDQYASSQLTAWEKKHPVIKEQPSVVYEHTRDATMASLNESRVGKALSYALSPVVNVAENFASKEQETEVVEKEDKEDKEIKEIKEHSLQETVGRMFTVGTKLQRRALEKAFERVDLMTQRAGATLESISHSVDLIEYAKSLDEKTGASAMFHEIWDEHSEEEAEKIVEEEVGSSKQKRIERRTLIVSRNLTNKLSALYNNMLSISQPYVPESTFVRLYAGKSLLGAMQDLFNNAKSFHDVSDVCIHRTKESIVYLNELLRDAAAQSKVWMNTSRPMAWFVQPIAESKNEEETAEERRVEGEKEEVVTDESSSGESSSSVDDEGQELSE